MNNKVIYTCLTNNYDELLQYPALSSEYDYICFSNDYEPGTKVGHWEIWPIPFDCVSKARLSRYVKLLPHKVLKKYDWSVWLDANIAIKDQSVYEAFDKCIQDKISWAGVRHPKFNCIYDDAKECLRIGRARYSEIKEHIMFLRKNQYPRKFGLFENNVILRSHNKDIIITIDEQWWDLYSKYSPRDQHSLFYIFWKNNFYPSMIFPETVNARNSPSIKCVGHTPLNLKDNFKLRFREVKYRIMLRFIKLFDF